MIAYLYRIINDVTDDVYIGSTIQSIKQRFKAHRSNANLKKPGWLYDCMRDIGIHHFRIELLEEIEIEHISELGLKEREHCDRIRPSLNMILPKTNIEIKSTGRIYTIEYITDIRNFYIGSTTNSLEFRLCQHRSASNKGTTPLYTFMREHGKDNFSIRCVEDDIPVSDLIIREDHWIREMKPTLNKSIHLTITDQERDRMKYLKNREKRLRQVHERRLLKRDEINAQKMEHYRKQREILNNTVIVPYDNNPSFTEEHLQKQNLLNLKIIARRFSIHSFPNRKAELIRRVLDLQTQRFSCGSSVLIRH